MSVTMKRRKKIYIGFGSGSIAAVNAPDGKQIGSIKLSSSGKLALENRNGFS